MQTTDSNDMPPEIAHLITMAKRNGHLRPEVMMLVMAVRPDALAKRLLQKFAPGSRDNTLSAVLPRADVANVIVQGSPNNAHAIRTCTVPAGHILFLLVAEGRCRTMLVQTDNAPEGEAPEGATVHWATTNN